MRVKISKSLKIILPFLSGIALLMALLYLNNAPEYLAHMELDPVFFLITIGVNILLYSVLARRWQIIVLATARNVSVKWTQCLLYYAMAAALGVFIPNTAAMLSVGAGSLERFHAIPLKKGSATIVLEKSCEVFLIMLSIPSVILLITNMITVEQALVLLLSLLLLFSLIFFIGVDKTKSINYLMMKWVSSHNMNVEKRVLLKVYALTLITQVLQIFRVWVIAKTVGIDIALPMAALVLAGNQASSLLSITPGGLGMKEGTTYLIFHAAGFLTGQISAYLIAYRSLTSLFLLVFWLPVRAKNLLWG